MTVTYAKHPERFHKNLAHVRISFTELFLLNIFNDKLKSYEKILQETFVIFLFPMQRRI